MSRIYDCAESAQLVTGLKLAASSLGRGELVVIPTDTVYGVAADAFSPAAVRALLAAKGRGRQQPPPVLVADVGTLHALAESVPAIVTELVAAFWPGGLTIVLNAQPSLAWDLGDTHGTVAVRMPDNPIALALLRETGPLAVSSANLTGLPSATSAADAELMLGTSVHIYLDGGPVGQTASTIIDASRLSGPGGKVHVLRDGAISREQLRGILGDLLAEDDEAARTEAAASEAAAESTPSEAAAAESTPSEAAAAESTPSEDAAGASAEPEAGAGG
ncbi:tRNA threonylcarbamoyl adenosine modification protein (Sua5/YciO/YrdC/YwlC family) [Mycetocola sp. BIGb0189]|uniref:L-threonylcarbamoyladenylate synthase n=1 Tax=Mycetocola sp. BIGb0189 TaxID=2940604 RepID=UPI002169C07F|nr:L-threonylcarbamoyladenylate synthase [Mycetocola sp. BIGb0189]MCS4274899.1 tRNA threonylcarbamoyl adenosine modification protein (Sua5/YciO/YrdC/YwlC family) [Mycetocola sp. BIGb0189]